MLTLLIPLLGSGQVDFVTVLSIIGIPTLISSAFAYWINRNTLKSHQPVQNTEIDLNRTEALGQTIDRLTRENTRLDSMNTNMIGRVKNLEDALDQLKALHENELTKLKQESADMIQQIREEQAAKFKLIETLLEQKGITIPEEVSKILQMP